MLKAIETSYKGYLFRSRLEARWAVFFDSIGIPWEYEKEGYQLPSGWYLPDFWLPSFGAFAEVKPVAPSPGEQGLCIDLSMESDFPTIMLIGVPGDHPCWVFCSDSTDSSGGTDWWDECFWAIEKDPPHSPCICSNNHRLDRAFMTPKTWESWEPMKQLHEVIFPSACIDRAFQTSRSARF